MGSQVSPSGPKLKRSSSTSRAGPHRRTSSITSSCVSLESGDQDLLCSPVRSAAPGKSHAAVNASSPRTPAGASPGEKSPSPAALKKRRSSIGGIDDLARGLDFSNSSSPVNEEKKLHSFLTKGGGHKKVAQSSSPITQANSPGKKTGTTPPGKEKPVPGRPTVTSVLSPKKLSDGREVGKKEMSSPRKLGSASRSMHGITSASSELRRSVDLVTVKKSSPLRASLDGRIGKLSSPRLTPKSKVELGSAKGRTNGNGELAALDSLLEGDIKTDYQLSSRVSLGGKIERKLSPSPSSLKSKLSLTSPTDRNMTKKRQDSTSSQPQPGRVRALIDKAAQNVELLRPEMESVEVPVYSESEYERGAKSEKMSHSISLVPLQHGEVDEERSTLLASLMVSGNVGDEDMRSLEQVVEPGFDNETELPTSWLSEDLPCMFSSLSQLPEPGDTSSSRLGDPLEILDEPSQRSSDERLAIPDDAEKSRSVVVFSPESLVSTMNETFAAEDSSELSNGVSHPAMDESAWNHELNSFCDMLDGQVDEFEAELCTQIDATYEIASPQLSVPQVEYPVDRFEAELRTQIDTTFESPQFSVPPVGQQYVVPVVDEAILQSCPSQATENTQTGGAQSQLISSQIGEDPRDRSQAAPMPFLEGDQEILQLDSSSFAEHFMNAPDVKPSLQEERRNPIFEDKLSISHGSSEQQVLESSDDEFLDDTIEGSQLNLKQSFDDVAEPVAVSRSRVDEIDISHGNIANVVPVTVGPRKDTCDSDFHEPALSTESECAAEFIDGQDRGVLSPTYLDQDMKILEEYWTESVADEPSKSDAGQNDAEDLQPSTMSVGARLPNTVEDGAAKSLPPIELPVSLLPITGKLILTVEESIDLEPPGQAHAQVGATKIAIVNVNEEIPPREGWLCPNSAVSSPSSDNEVDTLESANHEEVDEFDEVFHLYGNSEEFSTWGLRVSSMGTEHPHVVDSTQVVLDLQNINGEAVTEHQDFSTRSFSPQDKSVDDLLHDPFHGSWTGEVYADQEPNHEDLRTPPKPVLNSNNLHGVNIHNGEASGDHLSSDECLHHGGPDSSVKHPDLLRGTTIQDASHKSFFEAAGVPETHIALHGKEVLEPSPEDSITLQGGDFSVKFAERGDRDGALVDDDQADCIFEINRNQSSPDRDFSNLIVRVAAETDGSHDLDLEILPSLPKMECGQTVLSPRSSANTGSAAKEVDPSVSNALFPAAGINIDKEHSTEASIMSSSDMEEDSFYGEVHGGNCIYDTTSLGECQERTEDSILGLEVRMRFDQEERQGLYNSEEGAAIMNYHIEEPDFNSTEFRDTFQDMRSASKELNSEVPGQDCFQIAGDDEFQDDERIKTSALQNVVTSQRDASMSSSQISLKDCSHTDDYSDYATTAAVDKSLPIGVYDESNTHISSVSYIPVSNEDDAIPDKFDAIPDKLDAKPEVDSTASLDIMNPGFEAAIYSTASSTDTLEKDEAIHVVAGAPSLLSAKELPDTTLNDVNVLDRHQRECEVNEENSFHGDRSKLRIVIRQVELDREISLLKVDPSGSKPSTEDQLDPLHEGSIITNGFHGSVNPCSPTQNLNIADSRGDTTEDLVIYQERSEETSSNASTSACTPRELIEHHDSNVQEVQVLGTMTSSGDQISPVEDAAEVYQAPMTVSDAKFGNSSSQGLPLTLFVTSSQDSPTADDVSMKKDSDFSWKGDDEGESLNGTLEEDILLEDVDTVMDNVEKSFVISDQDTSSLNVDANDTEEESLFEDEEKVVFSPNNSKYCTFDPDTKSMDANEIQNPSSISCRVDRDEDSVNEGVAEKSLLEVEDTVVFGPKDTSEATILGSDEVQNVSNASWKVDSEEDNLNGSQKGHTFQKDKDMDVEEQTNASWNSSASKNEESIGVVLARDVPEDEENGLPCAKDPFSVFVQETSDSTITDGGGIQFDHSYVSWTADNDELGSLNESLEEESSLEDDTVVYSPMDPLVKSGQDLPDTQLLVDDKTEGLFKFPEKADKEGKKLDDIGLEEVESVISVVEEPMPKVPEAMPVLEVVMPEAQETVVDNYEEPLVIHTNTHAEALMIDDVRAQETWRDLNEEEETSNGNFVEKDFMVEVQEMVDHGSACEPPTAPDVAIEKHQTWRIDEGGETSIQSLEEESVFEVEEKETSNPKEPFVTSDEENVDISNLEELPKLSTWTTASEGGSSNVNLKGEFMLEAQEKAMDSSEVKNVLVYQVPEVNGSLQSSSDQDLVCHSKAEDGTITLQESVPDISTNAAKVENVENPQVMTTDYVDEDSALDQCIMASAVEDRKNCVMTNGNHLQESDCQHEPDAAIGTPTLAKERWISGMESKPHDFDSPEEATESQSQECTPYPLLASQPPFSGSKQDYLWEEQAEAYSSGGRGTPARNGDGTPAAAPFHPSSFPGDQPFSSDDQIQPASGPMNNGRTTAGPSQGGDEDGSEPKKKGKLHTPLRSLLLEDANKSTDGDPSTPNIVTSSPSFIRRLFRVKSTPSRSAERDVTQTKLKKSSSMWVSCLGSPHVKQ